MDGLGEAGGRDHHRLAPALTAVLRHGQVRHPHLVEIDVIDIALRVHIHARVRTPYGGVLRRSDVLPSDTFVATDREPRLLAVLLREVDGSVVSNDPMSVESSAVTHRLVTRVVERMERGAAGGGECQPTVEGLAA